MSTYQSVQSASVADAPLVIPKPVDLAAGDVMVAGIWINNDQSGNVSITTPSGWTFQESQAAASGNERLHVFWKVADSADVAASNFTFVNGSNDSTYHMLGHIVRATDFGIFAGEASGQGTGSTTLTFAGFTPTRANTLFICFIGVEDSTLPTISALSIATNNPTWTERAEATFNDTSRGSALAVYTATRPEITATGNFTATVTNPNSNDSYGVCVAFSPRVDGSASPETKLNAYAFAPIQSAKANAVTDEPTAVATNPTVWTPITKA